jgi:E3 ubiquitin-protein ligase HECTD3
MGTVDPARVRLGRIRCLTDAVECLKAGGDLPSPICYVPKSITLEICELKETLSILDSPKEGAKVVEKISDSKTIKITCKGQPLFNGSGGWVKVISPYHQGWLLLEPLNKHLKMRIKVVPSHAPSIPEESAGKKQPDKKEATDWLKVVEQMCTLHFGKQPQLTNQDEEEAQKLCISPPGWNLEADEELAQFLVRFGASGMSGSTGAGGVQGNEHFSRVQASSEEDQIPDMLNPDLEDHYWESDGSLGEHWLRFHMKPGVVVQKFALLVDADDGSYLPKRVVVKGGATGNTTIISTRNFSTTDYDTQALQLFLTPLTTYHEVIEVYFKTCYQGGIDCRIRGVSISTQPSVTIFLESENLSKDVFTTERIARYPKLQPFQPDQLFYRGLLLRRIAYLLNLDITYLLPRAKQKVSSRLDAVCLIRQLWPLSSQRNSLIQYILGETSSSSPSRPVLYINRITAREHLGDPSKDPECKKTVFNQVMHELKKHTKASNYNYRWAGHWSQWWECKFTQEGIIDQGGGFRDSLADMAEELCPSDPDADVALPLFIRSSNQSQDSSNVYRDTYIPHPSCSLKDQYFFVGQLMGAMFRSQESFILSLSQLVWKQLVGEPVSWTRDFVTIDSAEVKFIDSIETMKREKFEEAFEGALKFTTVLSDGETVALMPGGGEELVTYDNRLKYCKMVKERRMNESKVQIDAIRQGLVSVIPVELLNLITWQELELKVCGNPEISVEALKKSTRYDSSLSESCQEVKIMWEALEKFSNDDRSRFLRFITGRRRLPCTIFIDSAENHNSKLPTSATCSNTLYLPKYKNIEEAVDKLRYASYNCVAIDTDMSPWD